jgi:hypothetical protein
MLIPKQFEDILSTIDDCLKNERTIPALILFYTSIDNMANLAENSGETISGVIFKNWVKKWMLDKYKLPCNEIDLWSARCGLLHQQISESNLTDKGLAREVFYCHGGANPLKLEIIISATRRNAVVVTLEEVIEIFKKGMIDCLAAIAADSNWKNLFNKKLSKYFITDSLTL